MESLPKSKEGMPIIVYGELRAGVRKSIVRLRDQGAEDSGGCPGGWNLSPTPLPFSLMFWHWGVPGSGLSCVSGLTWPLWVGL